MAYSACIKHGIGIVRRCLEHAGLGLADARFAKHGEHEIAADAPLVLVACSGGRDSLALAALARTVTRAWGMRCGAVIVDHNMQEGSAEVAQQAARTCEQLGLAPVSISTVTVPATGEGAEAAARDARYAALVTRARESSAEAVLLAHTADDQAEGILIDLMRATGTDALAGMRAQSVKDGVLFLRPLLEISRAQTTQICEELGISWWDDPTNGDSYPPEETLPANFPLRSRIRHTLLPFFSEFAGCDMAQRLSQMSRIVRRDVDYLDEQMELAYANTVHLERGRAQSKSTKIVESTVNSPQSSEYSHRETPTTEFASRKTGDGLQVVIDARTLAGESPAIRMRVIAKALHELDLPVSAQHIGAVESLVSDWHGQGPVSLPRKYSANRKKHVIRVCENDAHANRRCARED